MTGDRAGQIASDVITDSVFAVRSFRRSPGWTSLTLLTIALGVGASTAVFSVADAFLVRPLPYRDASRVYAVSLQGRLQSETVSLPISAAILREWRNNARTIDAAAAYGGQPRALLQGDANDVGVATAIVDTSFLAFTGARPLIGRNFTADETVPNGPRAIMLAEGFWRRQFGASPGVLGRVLRLEVGGDPDSRLRTIVGVMQAPLGSDHTFSKRTSELAFQSVDDPRGRSVPVRHWGRPCQAGRERGRYGGIRAPALPGRARPDRR